MQTSLDDLFTPAATIKKDEIAQFLFSLDQNTALLTIEHIFMLLASWWQEYGWPHELLSIVCKKLDIDRRIAEIYLRYPTVISMMERLRGGQSVRQVKCSLLMTEQGRLWWHALLVMKVLYKCDGRIAHSRLLRWLGHRANRDEIRSALDKLRDSGILETYFIEGADSLRPVTWYRLRPVCDPRLQNQLSF